jgi:hypothetical protein
MADEQKKEGPEEVNLENTGVVVKPRVDVTGFIGKKTKIASAKEYKGQYGYYVKIETDNMGTLKDETGQLVEDKEGKLLPAIASKVVGLTEDKEGRIGWTKDSDMATMLEKHGVEHYKKLVGKEVVVQGKDVKGSTFLTFL